MKYLGKEASNSCGLKYIKVMCGCTIINFLKETIFILCGKISFKSSACTPPTQSIIQLPVCLLL